MNTNDAVFAGAIPDLYDRFLVPLIFQTYADDLAERIAAARPKRLLEIAAGTGALTRALAARLPADATIIATDLNQPMLDRAIAQQADDKRITFQIADAMALPFEDGGFDVVACQFGVMFFPDKVKAYREALRLLRPGGRYVFNVWDALPANVFAETVTMALGAMFPEDPPLFMARTPHGHFDQARIRADLTAAGFGSIDMQTVARISHGGSAREVAMTYCQGTPMRAEIETRRPGGLMEATDKAAEALERRFGSGPIEGAIRAIVVEAMP
ncbi:Ubiquinone/menaquinone biosynthesis C-methylase UbiE [Kaistia soli DSM 19436]|uniref:Ubiquinone/menaquinone biosynthesis C-methylase UbiE n=1 Tax=Kaistia soli DSM 19436 TaxID=1122133 RepID=A0A1M5GY72_9HYPH|nr:class I SAM-dependent methyltransferase [Kaistia soli]SHG08525.1 Ubiquinone/menaquinone biosynthesis C-methylase UbiE [Kaistia soli DSM 19436]